jgi:peptidoglycan/LPS O-acetylase OafA/YrhL
LGYHFNIAGFYGGYLGVDIFFVLSGFLITGNILMELEKGKFDLKKFWFRRVFRLAPALMILLLFLVIWNNGWNESQVIRESIDDSLRPCLFYYANWYFI